MQSTRRRRVIINSDAKNEADDQFAIVHALLSSSLDV
jgi:purine nucleosidase